MVAWCYLYQAVEVQSDNENEGAYDTRQSQATIGDHRMVEIDLQTKTLQIQQDQHKIKTLEQKCKVKDEQMQKLEESIIQLRTEIKEKEKMLEITNKEKDILQIQTKHVEQVDVTASISRLGRATYISINTSLSLN